MDERLRRSLSCFSVCSGDSRGDQTSSVLPFQAWRLCVHQHPGDRQVRVASVHHQQCSRAVRYASPLSHMSPDPAEVHFKPYQGFFDLFCRVSVAAHPLDGPVDQPSVRVLQTTREPNGQHQEAVGEPEEAQAAAQVPGPAQTRFHQNIYLYLPQPVKFSELKQLTFSSLKQ